MTQQLDRALNILAKWRTIFAGWQLGTRPIGDPECDAVRDHREVTILLRAEVSAMVCALTEGDPAFRARFEAALEKEAGLLSADYAVKFPGCVATEVGIQMDARAAETMKNWRP